jgi:hypothetical protein
VLGKILGRARMLRELNDDERLDGSGTGAWRGAGGDDIQQGMVARGAGGTGRGKTGQLGGKMEAVPARATFRGGETGGQGPKVANASRLEADASSGHRQSERRVSVGPLGHQGVREKETKHPPAQVPPPPSSPSPSPAPAAAAVTELCAAAVRNDGGNGGVGGCKAKDSTSSSSSSSSSPPPPPPPPPSSSSMFAKQSQDEADAWSKFVRRMESAGWQSGRVPFFGRAGEPFTV